MGKKLGRLAKSTECMLNTSEGVKELMAFVGRTARLKRTYSDVPHALKQSIKLHVFSIC